MTVPNLSITFKGWGTGVSHLVGHD